MNKQKLIIINLSIAALISSCHSGITNPLQNNPIITPLSSEAHIYKVGPNEQYKSLQEVANLLQSGDTIYVDGDAEYSGNIKLTKNGTKENPIRIIGITINNKRPIIRASNTASEILVRFDGSNYLFENFEVIGNLGKATDKSKFTARGIYQVADDLTIRNCIVHDTRNGIMAADLNSGDLTIESSNIYANGYADGDHNIYIASDRVRYPNSVTKIMFNYIHDSKKGAGLKTRTLRNEIYYNWFENNAQSEIDMYGADLGPGTNPIDDTHYSTDNHETQDELRKIDPSYGEAYIREDTDFVGNLVISDNKTKMLTIGGDGGSGGPTRNGTSFGRYRFINNTFINTYKLNPSDKNIIGQLKFGVGSIEFDNNIVYNQYGTETVFSLNDYDSSNDIHHTNSDLRWSKDKQFVGSNNWFKTGSKVPTEFKNNITGNQPGFVNFDNQDFHLTTNNELSKSGTFMTSYRFLTAIYYSNLNFIPVMDNEFRNPLMMPLYEPVNKNSMNTRILMNNTNQITIGAY